MSEWQPYKYSYVTYVEPLKDSMGMTSKRLTKRMIQDIIEAISEEVPATFTEEVSFV